MKYFAPASLILSIVVARSDSVRHGQCLSLLVLRISVLLLCWLSVEEVTELFLFCRLCVMLATCRSGGSTLDSSFQCSQLVLRSRPCYISEQIYF